jgi:predicted nucleotidyltransferase
VAVPNRVAEYAASVAEGLVRVLHSAPLGVYLFGSAVLDAWVPSRSDIDILAIVPRTLVQAEKQAVTEVVLALPRPADLDLAVVAESIAIRREVTPVFELVVYPPEPDYPVGSEDLSVWANLALVREHSVVLLGSRPTDLIAEVPRTDVCRAFASSLSSWDDDPSYSLLNACRALMYVREGVLVSKFEGARWAVSTGEVDADAVEVAVERARGGSLENPDREAVSRFVGLVREELGSATY